MGKRIILLTGATGFVGSHVLNTLLANGETVHCLINKTPPNIKHENIHIHRFNLLKYSKTRIEEIFELVQPSHCIHCAWYTNHKDYLTSTINLEWLKNSKKLIDDFYQFGGKRFIGLGSCVEYDMEHAADCIEDQTFLNGNTIYANAKIELFKFLNSCKTDKSVSFAWVRLFFVYGPQDRAGRLIPYIYGRLSSNEKAKPRYGALCRDFIYAEDVAKQIVNIAISEIQGAVNSGTGNAVTIQEIFDTMGQLMKKPQLIETNKVVDSNEAPVIQANTTKYTSTIERNSTMSLENGLAKTIQWLMKNDYN